MSIDRTGWRVGMGLAIVVGAMAMAGCQSEKRAELASDDPATEPAAPGDVDAGADVDAPAASEAQARKGKRITGGFPPIRRPDMASGLTVPGAQRFILGGDQPSSFYCDVQNEGTTTVMVFAERNGGSTVVAKLGPGDSASHRFQPTEAAVIANLSPMDEAKLKVRVWGDTNLGMEYEPTGE